jgi:LysR family transcriptional regulator, nod-box dependent transcriptional activator
MPRWTIRKIVSIYNILFVSWINEVRFKGLDLNLLAALDVLIEERSTSRAAERLHLSQPATSAALARLRAYFNDPLLTAHGKRMMPTAYALELHSAVKTILANVETMIAKSATFSPGTSDRIFRIATSDYLSTVLFADLLPKLQKTAPFVRFDFQPPSDGIVDAIDRGEIDLMVCPDALAHPKHPHELLFEERHVVAGCARNPMFASPITEDAFFAAGHIAVEMGRTTRKSFAEGHLRDFERKRRVEIFAAAFTLVPELLVGTNRITVMHERLARRFAERMPIAWQPLPIAFPVMREVVQFHSTRKTDQAIQWLVGEILASAHSANHNNE